MNTDSGHQQDLRYSVPAITLLLLLEADLCNFGQRKMGLYLEQGGIENPKVS